MLKKTGMASKRPQPVCAHIDFVLCYETMCDDDANDDGPHNSDSVQMVRSVRQEHANTRSTYREHIWVYIVYMYIPFKGIDIVHMSERIVCI